MSFQSKFKEKLSETLKAVIPILAIVLLLCFTITPIPPSILMTFLCRAVLLIVEMLFKPESTEHVSESILIVDNTVDLGKLFLHELPEYMKEMAISILPIVFFFGLFQLILRDLNKRSIIKIVVGLVYTYIGLVLFLTGVNVGFMPAGNFLGQTIAGFHSHGLSFQLV